MQKRFFSILEKDLAILIIANINSLIRSIYIYNLLSLISNRYRDANPQVEHPIFRNLSYQIVRQSVRI